MIDWSRRSKERKEKEKKTIETFSFSEWIGCDHNGNRQSSRRKWSIAQKLNWIKSRFQENIQRGKQFVLFKWKIYFQSRHLAFVARWTITWENMISRTSEERATRFPPEIIDLSSHCLSTLFVEKGEDARVIIFLVDLRVVLYLSI